MAAAGTVALTGATGFIGSSLTRSLAASGIGVFALSRNPEHARRVLGASIEVVEWDGRSELPDHPALESCHAFINLMGESISGVWTKKKREALLRSRTDSASAIVRYLARTKGRARCFIQASAVGYYGSRGEEELGEEAPAGGGYLSEVSRSVEESAAALRLPGVRVVTIRTGLVLGPAGGTLPLLALPVRLGFGGFPGSGAGWVAWIHLDDEVSAIRYLLEEEGLAGPVNLTAPEPVRMRELVAAAGRVLHRPVWLRVPPVALRLALGPLADETLLCSQRVVPRRLLEHGFRFRYPRIDGALAAALSAPR